ncbi:hypothetical protein PG988_011627 [Apiospora saccharicola]
MQSDIRHDFHRESVSFNEMVAYATVVANDYEIQAKRAAVKKNAQDSSSKSSGSNNKSSAPRTTAASKTTKPAGGSARLTPDELKKFISEGRCFSCREIGHTSRDCPQKKTAASAPSNDNKINAIIAEYNKHQDNLEGKKADSPTAVSEN